MSLENSTVKYQIAADQKVLDECSTILSAQLYKYIQDKILIGIGIMNGNYWEAEDFCYEEHMNEDNYWTSLFATEPPEI